MHYNTISLIEKKKNFIQREYNPSDGIVENRKENSDSLVIDGIQNEPTVFIPLFIFTFSFMPAFPNGHPFFTVFTQKGVSGR